MAGCASDERNPEIEESVSELETETGHNPEYFPLTRYDKNTVETSHNPEYFPLTRYDKNTVETSHNPEYFPLTRYDKNTVEMSPEIEESVSELETETGYEPEESDSEFETKTGERFVKLYDETKSVIEKILVEVEKIAHEMDNCLKRYQTFKASISVWNILIFGVIAVFLIAQIALYSNQINALFTKISTEIRKLGKAHDFIRSIGVNWDKYEIGTCGEVPKIGETLASIVKVVKTIRSYLREFEDDYGKTLLYQELS